MTLYKGRSVLVTRWCYQAAADYYMEWTVRRGISSPAKADTCLFLLAFGSLGHNMGRLATLTNPQETGRTILYAVIT